MRNSLVLYNGHESYYNFFIIINQAHENYYNDLKQTTRKNFIIIINQAHKKI